MDELDKLFKDKLRDRTFEFKDAYWEAAEQLINEEEEGRRKRGGIWWKLGLLLFLVVAISYFTMNRPLAASVSKVEPTSESKAMQEKADIITTIPKEIAKTENAVVSEKKTIDDNGNKTLLKDIPSNKNASQTKKQILNSNTQAPNLKPNASNATTKKGLNGLDQKNTLNGLQMIDSQLIDDQAPILDTLEQVQAKKDIATLIDSKPTPSVEDETPAVEELAVLETIPSLEIPDGDCEGCFEFQKVKYKRFAFGVNAEGLIHPFDNSESWWFGGTVGLIAQYKINRRLSLRSGLNYSLTRGTNKDFVKDLNELEFLGNNNTYRYEVETQYSFGSRSVETFFTPETFHVLEIPLLLQMRMKKHIIEAGLQFNFLAGVRGRSVSRVSLFPWESVALESNFGVNKNSEKNWILKDQYKKFFTSMSLGYKYKLSSKLDIGFNAYYRLGSIINTNNDEVLDSLFAESGNKNFFVPERLHFRFGANWYF